MANLFVGDIHGCYQELQLLLEKVQFEPNQDTLWLTGDLVSRGAYSLEVLRYIKSLGSSVRLVLGNHDLHLIAIHAGVSQAKKKEHLDNLLDAPDLDELIDWLRQQPILQIDQQKKIIMVHAGISPAWDLATALNCANEVHAILRSKTYQNLLPHLYGNEPKSWSDQLTSHLRYRYIVNVFTRIRYCSQLGELDFLHKSDPQKTPHGLIPWFKLRHSSIQKYHLFFGHWAALNGRGTPADVYALDTGCCWGGKLTLFHWEQKKYYFQPSLPTK